MPNTAASQKLAEQLDTALAQKEGKNLVADAESSVNVMLNGWPSNQGLYAQLKRLADFINQTKAEIGALKADDLNGEVIPSATDELDAIVDATAQATNRIMDAAEVLMEVTAALPEEEAAKGMDAIMSIYEACTFQDITGQRITKVVSLLKVIENRLGLMTGGAAPSGPDESAHDTGVSVSEDADAHTSTTSSKSDEDLLNGPALPGEGTTQDEIDALFNEPLS